MKTYTAEYLIRRARQRADQEDVGFIGEVEGYDLLNEEYRMYCLMLEEMGYHRTWADYDITADGAASYTLPDFMRILWVAEVDGNSIYPLFNEAHKDAHYWENGDNYYETRRYLLSDNKLKLLGNPTTGTYRVRYVPEPDDMTAEDDSVALLPGGDRWVTIRMAIQMRIKEEVPYQDLILDLEKAEEVLRTHATRVIAGQVNFGGARYGTTGWDSDWYDPWGGGGPWPRRGQD